MKHPNRRFTRRATSGLARSAALSALVAASTANATVVLVQTRDPGFYNASIGTALNRTNGGETGPFPVGNDSALNFATAPDLSAASGALGKSQLSSMQGLRAVRARRAPRSPCAAESHRRP